MLESPAGKWRIMSVVTVESSSTVQRSCLPTILPTTKDHTVSFRPKDIEFLHYLQRADYLAGWKQRAALRAIGQKFQKISWDEPLSRDHAI
jgi:hypothetical protein